MVAHLLTPETFALVSTLSMIMWRFFKAVKQNVKDESKENLKPLEDKIDKALEAIDEVKSENIKSTRDTQKEILRLQILEGIDSHRLSESEVRFFYDKYHKAGGNSFVTAKVKQYLRDVERESKNNETR